MHVHLPHNMITLPYMYSIPVPIINRWVDGQITVAFKTLYIAVNSENTPGD